MSSENLDAGAEDDAALIAPRHVAAMRTDACRSCDHLTRTLGAMTCNQCGCIVALKTKFFHAKCPVGLW